MSTTTSHPPRSNNAPNTASPGIPMASSAGANEDGVTIKSMRLKVLYTFDDQNKTNHLARWPDILPIQTVAMDDANTIGVVELQICIRAIVQNSPELVARIGQDYTVYAFDYSEYENPLVGQGMLSKALAAASPNPVAPASQSQQLVTGRVCKNILGLFSNGVKETLEVKLRLVPVPTVVNNEYVETMNKYRDTNRATPNGFDSNEWSSFMASQNYQQASNRPSPVPVQQDGTSMEVLNQLLNPQIQQPQPHINTFNTFDLNMNAEVSGNESRGTMSSIGKGKKTSRPSSRASVKRPRGRKPKATTGGGGNTSGYEEGTDGDEGQAPRKRAKIQKADYTNNSAFTTGVDSLHKAATTSGPLRVLRPLAMSPLPQNNALSNTQDIPRAPTPVPKLSKQNITNERASSRGTSATRRESFLAQSQSAEVSRQHLSPHPSFEKPEDQLRYSIESAGPSPEKVPSPADTLPEICSSPPLMRTRPSSRMRSSPPCPSSPDLPQMPRTDSGFMSGSLDDLFGEDEEMPNNDVEVVDRPENHSPLLTAKLLGQQIQVDLTLEEEENDGLMELPPHRVSVPRQSESRTGGANSRAGSMISEDGQILPPLRAPSRPPSRPVSQDKNTGTPQLLVAIDTQVSSLATNGTRPAEPQQVEGSSAPPATSRPESRTMARTSSTGSLTLPTIPASDPALPPSTLQRSQTWSEAPHPATDAPLPPMGMMPYVGPYPGSYGQPEPAYSRLVDSKKVQIKQRLEMAIANGEMPPFCANCGAIETPTWRKAWSQEMQGSPGYHDYSDKPGCVTAVNILTRNDEGKPTSYQLIKKFLAPGESQDAYKEFLLCNPCGIWMSKYKTQRPPERWESNGTFAERGPRGEPKKRPQQRPSRSKKMGNGNLALPTSEANFPFSEVNFPPSEANFPYSEASYPQTERTGPPEGISPSDTTSLQQIDGASGQNPPQRKNSIRNGKRLNAMTSEAASAALRRAIQSSPARWAGTQQCPVDVEEDLGSTRRLLFPSPRKDGSPKVLGQVTTNIVAISNNLRSPKEAALDVNKENCPPAISAEDPDADFMKMFEEELARPTTPVAKSPPPNPFKTPTRPTPNHRPITRSVTRSIRSAKSPGQLLLFNRTPTKTPGSRQSQRLHDAVFESPFTATLNQLMSEANNHASPLRGGNGMELDFANLPALPHATHNDNMDMNFSLEDFFSTDVPMPSSPPRMNFHLYEDPMGMENVGNINWDNFGRLETKGLNDGHDKVKVKEEPEESPRKQGFGKEERQDEPGA